MTGTVIGKEIGGLIGRQVRRKGVWIGNAGKSLRGDMQHDFPFCFSYRISAYGVNRSEWDCDESDPAVCHNGVFSVQTTGPCL